MHLQPQVQIVDVGKDAEFQCIVSGHPVHEINWLHDGKPIIRDNRIEVSLNAILREENIFFHTLYLLRLSSFRFFFSLQISNIVSYIIS